MLSEPALKTANDYLHLPIAGHDINCPYFNNRYANVRAGLRVMIGKGSVEDITEEVILLSLREKIDLKKLSDEELKKFLTDNGIGVDCSGLIYHVLDAELKARNLGAMRKHIKFPYVKTPWRKLLSRMRPAEHAGARTIAAAENCDKISLRDVLPGDMITMLKTGQKHDRNHMLLITKIDYDDAGVPKKIYYIHSLQWRADGRYGHGVREGQIDVLDINKGLLEQNWKEKDRTGAENETLEHARLAEELFLVHFRALA
jgi:hypothetical protein